MALGVYIVERDMSVLDPELPSSGIATAALNAFHAFRDGRTEWDVTIGEPEFDRVQVTLFSPGDEAMSIDDRKRWDAALCRFGLRGN